MTTPPSATGGTHAEPEQTVPPAQSADVAHEAGHEAELPEQSRSPLQAGEPVECAASGRHEPVAQDPHGPQAVSQQTPEMQFDDWHWPPEEQEVPFDSRATQVPALQKSLAMQSLSALQLDGHVALLPSQTKGLHDETLPAASGVHVPVPQLPHAPQAALQE